MSIRTSWAAECAKAAAQGRPASLIRAFWLNYLGPLTLVTTMFLLKSGSQLLQTQMLSRLLRFLAQVCRVVGG